MTTPGDDTSRGELAPVRRRERMLALDAARGFALLGIFAVNVQSFGEASGRFASVTPGGEESSLDAALFYFVRVFCEGKFYPLFSMLFGMGLVLQMGRAPSGSFGVMYARRLAALLAIGFLHAVLIWAGDILFVYAIAGFVLLLTSKLGGKALLGIGAGLVLFVSVVCGACWGGVWSASEDAVESRLGQAEATFSADGDPGSESSIVEETDELVPIATAEHGRAFARLTHGFSDGTIGQGPHDPSWIALESQAFHDGPWHDAFLFNLLNWVMSLIAGIFSYAWHVLGLFFIGAGLMKLGVFRDASGVRWRRVLLLGGVAIGLPTAAASVALPVLNPTTSGYVLGTTLQYASGPLVALLYICMIWTIAELGQRLAPARAIVGTFARVGRMGLTNYLLHSVIFTAIFHWWGLGLFGELTRTQRLMLVPIVYATLCVTSWLWLKWFAMGPMEWAWRSLTYWKLQRLRAGSSDSPE